MPAPKAVVFDLGKVLVDFDYSIAGRRIAALSRMSASEVQAFIDHSPLLFRFETGEIDRQQFFSEIQAATGFRGTLAEFSEFFADIFTPIEPMVDLHDELRERGVPAYIFSNTNELAIGHIRRNFEFFSRFDGYVLSYEHGVMKPQPGLYEAVESCARLRGGEILYLDDRPENVTAGANRGWQAILHKSPETSRAIIESASLL
jgi:HAD superfamily hydrolase (TIGR01509 family)